MDEANTKASVLRDFVELLGWEIPGNTELEYSIAIGSSTHRVDYALLSKEGPEAFLEAKPLKTPLKEEHRQQISSYMRQESVEMGILSNGREYVFLTLDGPADDVKTIDEVYVRNLSKKIVTLEKFTTGALYKGKYEQLNAAEKLVHNARGKLLTYNILVHNKDESGNPFLSERPLLYYLDKYEQPHYLLWNEDSGYRPSPIITKQPSPDYRAVLLVTDRRIHYFAGHEDGDIHQQMEYWENGERDGEELDISAEIKSKGILSQEKIKAIEVGYPINRFDFPVSNKIRWKEIEETVQYINSIYEK
ncbi:type I restriction enzyme HsdR N-terminal domain-containing protein [Halorubrum sp. SD626R]|uniref:type I restriction enzyme HsdR N-terminal domain-containing protein n=1 Tax=Halorubrum sp. SD626R TaxID=1419722 RepID=UPI0018EE7B51|nr:type I restriction enzyme HsdR N-terminal domain-containing protein [Halorubrum sp. SD626R]